MLLPLLFVVLYLALGVESLRWATSDRRWLPRRRSDFLLLLLWPVWLLGIAMALFAIKYILRIFGHPSGE
jgi:hypothetical protein